ncbi:Transposase [Geobacillus sp. WSUCF1]|nr:Transposase [Geobacillus sp. WSUCF1]
MYRTLKTRFRAKKEVIQKLFECNRISAEVWNECLRLAKEHHLETGKWITKTELQKATKGRFSIHSQSIQAVVHKYIFARDGAKEARKKGEKIKYPYKKKKHFNTKWAKDGFVLHEDGTLELSLGIWNRKRQSPLVVKIDKEKLPNGKVKEIELVYDRGLWLCLSYEDGKKPKENPCKNRVAIDPGEIHTIAAICENGESLIITGRKIRSIHRLRNKKLKELQKLMSRCKKRLQTMEKVQSGETICTFEIRGTTKGCTAQNHETICSLVFGKPSERSRHWRYRRNPTEYEKETKQKDQSEIIQLVVWKII